MTRPSRIPGLLAACLSAVLLGAGCAAMPCRAPVDTVILLPDAEGKTGAVVVSAGGAERLLTEPRQAVTVAPGAVPGEPFAMTDAEVRAAVGPALEALPPPPAKFVLYFRRNSSELTGESAALVDTVVRTIRERGSADVSVAGYTDTVGDGAYNDRLSLSRARAVAGLLAGKGVDRAILKVSSHGEANPLVPTGDQVPEPRNRRVEVTVR
ncbi:MAG: OmpA family protein [Gemmatimonadota bacterium]